MNVKNHCVLGFKVTLFTEQSMLSLIAHAVNTGSQYVIASQNMHGLYVFFRDRAFRQLHLAEDTFVHADGMPIVWLGKLVGLDVRKEHRMAWNRFLIGWMRFAADSGLRVYYLGSTERVCNNALAVIRQSVPGLNIQGHHGFFDMTAGSVDNERVLESIALHRPHILIVGMGMGRQESWIVTNRQQVACNIIATSGACMEILAGELPYPPDWVSNLGFEWLFRLATAPRRVAFRYLGEPWIVCFYLFWAALTRGVKKCVEP